MLLPFYPAHGALSPEIACIKSFFLLLNPIEQFNPKNKTKWQRIEEENFNKNLLQCIEHQNLVCMRACVVLVFFFASAKANAKYANNNK